MDNALKILDFHDLNLYFHGMCLEAAKKDDADGGHHHISTVHAPHLGQRSASVALSTSNVWRDRAGSWGWVLSAFILINVVILGCALVSGSVFNGVEISNTHLQVFLIVLIIPTTAWMLFYKAYTCREEEAVLYKDVHAGPVWLRGKVAPARLLSGMVKSFRS